MSLFRSIGARPDATRGTVALETRKLLAALLATAGGIAGRPGVLLGAPAVLVTGSSTGWNYSVDKALFATSRGESDGAHILGNDGATLVPTIAAPGTAGASRIDIVYVMHPSNTENGDTISAPVFGCANGGATTGTPTPPSIPVGALELGRNTMTNSATSTLSTGNTITQTWPYTALRGTAIPVRNQTERDALTAYATAAAPITVHRLDTGATERSSGGTWVTTSGGAATSGLLAGTAPPAGTPLIERTWYGAASATNASGITTITIPGGGFPNGLVAAQVNLANATGTAQSAYVLQVGAASLTTVDVRVAQLVSGAFTFVSGATPSLSLTFKGW